MVDSPANIRNRAPAERSAGGCLNSVLAWSLLMAEIDTLGIIAGNRSLPLVFARQARSLGVKRLVAVAFEGETDPQLAALVDEIVWLKVGQLSKMISAFTSRGITQCVMVGQIAPKNLFDIRPDLRAMALLLKLKEKNAHTIFGAIANELKKDGVELIEATPWLQPLMPAAGFSLGPKFSGGTTGGRAVRLPDGEGNFAAGNRPDGGGEKRRRCSRWRGSRGRTNAWRAAANWRARTAARWRSRWRGKSMTCASTFPASARKRWKPAPPRRFPCWRSKPAKRCCWSRMFARSSPKSTKSRSLTRCRECLLNCQTVQHNLQ